MGANIRKEAERRSAVRKGLVALVVASLLIAFAVTAKNGLPEYLPGVSRNIVQIAFTDVGALRKGDDVRIADVRSGFVSDIRLHAGKPFVTMQLNDGRPVYHDATAYIAARSGLGQKYVALNPGTRSAGEVGPGDVVAASQTSSPVELDDVLDAFDAKTRVAVGSALRESGGGLAGRGADLNDGLDASNELLADLGAISAGLGRDGGADLVSMLRSANLLSQSLDGQELQIGATTRQLANTLDAFTVDDNQPFSEAIAQSEKTLTDTRAALDDLRDPLKDTRKAAEELRPGAKALGAATPDLRGFLRESPTTLDKVPDLMDVAKPAVTSLTDAVDEATPLVTQLATALGRAELPLSVLAPYSPEALLFFQNAASALSKGDGAGRWLRYYPILTPESLIGTVPLRDPTASRQAYPAPNEARTHREGSIFGEGFH